MNMKIVKLARTMMLAAAGTLLFTLNALAQALPAAQPPVARIWIYHELNPNESLAQPYIRIDGGVVGASAPGTAFYRDLPAGRHQISVDSYVDDGNQTKVVDLVPGSQLYAKIVPFGDIVQGGGEFGGGYHRNTYYLWLYPPELAQPAIARSQIVAAVAPR
jgi:hypothetical protein